MNDLVVSAVIPSVELAHGQPTCTSLAVGVHFRKSHKNVLRDIKELDCSESFRRLNFEPSPYINSQGKEQPAIRMTRDGFMFLVMGYTGAAAARIKEAYIQRFNEMEAALRLLPGNAQLPAADLIYYRLRERELISLQRQHIRLQRQHMRLQRELLGLRLPRPVDHTQGDLFAGGAA